MKKEQWIGLGFVLTVGLTAPTTVAEPAPVVEQTAPSLASPWFGSRR